MIERPSESVQAGQGLWPKSHLENLLASGLSMTRIYNGQYDDALERDQGHKLFETSVNVVQYGARDRRRGGQCKVASARGEVNANGYAVYPANR